MEIICFQDPVINIRELKEIHSEINLAVPDPILLTDIHDGLEGVRDLVDIILNLYFQLL